jgi:energy-coupling factor transporter transmembrane protein EcfT
MDERTRAMQRRLRFSLIIVLSQILLIALAISWLCHMVVIAVSGSVYFVENNPLILWTEIFISLLVTIFAIYVLAYQIQRLGERRSTDRRSVASSHVPEKNKNQNAYIYTMREK